ncbi:hypothetical protein KBY76_07685 [Synechococcus sp. GreenBA-s]|nr:hypothetical protein [Synechococcus sp. GreenBA-s]
MGLSFRFRPCGAGRYAEAAFLGVWLVGWLLAETIVLGLLGAGARSLLLGLPLAGSSLPASPGPALAIGGFLVVWLSLWTVGGVLALRQLLRCLWAEDRLSLEDGSLSLSRRLGPFRTRQRLADRTIRQVMVRSGRGGALALGPLVAERRDGQVVTLTDLGTPQQRAEAAAALQVALALPDVPTVRRASAGALPRGWDCLEPSFGSALLVPERRRRRRQAVAISAIALTLAAILALTLQQARFEPSVWPFGLMLLALTLGVAWASAWLWLGRLEWRLEARRLVLQRRFGSGLRELAELRALQLREHLDSDGDAWYILASPDGAGRPILQVMGDPQEPRALGQWLAHRTGIPFEDAVPSADERLAARQQELERLRRQLAGSGRWGRLALRLLEGVERRGG